MVRLLVIGSVVRNDGRGTALRISATSSATSALQRSLPGYGSSRIEDYTLWRPVFRTPKSGNDDWLASDARRL